MFVDKLASPRKRETCSVHQPPLVLHFKSSLVLDNITVEIKEWGEETKKSESVYESNSLSI